jgi:hypothetical protein
MAYNGDEWSYPLVVKHGWEVPVAGKIIDLNGGFASHVNDYQRVR